MDKFWNNFLQTGKVEDYIKYVNNYYNGVNGNQVNQNADNNEGFDNKGTDYRGE
ncbi:MAG: hypothetical protein IJ731_08015 [Eubacterium sp.]|nr:hypothetical protein [Eubacterium sp.]